MPVDQKEFEDRFDNWIALEGVCQDDIEKMLDLLDGDERNLFFRRAFIRASWSYIEAVAAGLHDLIDFANKHEPENYPLIERRMVACKRVKKVLKAACKMMCPEWSPDFSTQKWVRFQQSSEKRNSLMHPKEPHDLYIADLEMDIAKDAICWLIETTSEMKRRAMARIGNPLP